MKKIILVLICALFIFSQPLTTLALDESPNAPPSSRQKNSTVEERSTTASSKNIPEVKQTYGIVKDNGYEEREISNAWGWGTMGYVTDYSIPAAKPGAERKTEQKNYSVPVDGGTHNFTFTTVFEKQALFEGLGIGKVWVQLTADPSKSVPVGYMLASGLLKYENLPDKAKTWHNAGCFDSVSYYPAIGKYYYSSILPLHGAIKLGYLSESSLTKKEKEALHYGSDMSYYTDTKKIFETGMRMERAIKLGIIKESDIPSEAYKAWKGEGYCYYIHTMPGNYHYQYYGK